MSAAFKYKIQQTEEEIRQNLILEHYPDVQKVARRMAHRFHSHVSVDELIQVGTLGLIEAIDRFEPQQNASLSTYAKIRIQGAILDFMRQNDWVPRSVRARSNMLKDVKEDLNKTLKRKPEHTEIAEKLEVSPERLNTIIKFADVRNVMSFEHGSEDDNRLGDMIGSEDLNAQDLVIQKEEIQILKTLIETLNPRQRQVVELYYYKGMTQNEIAKLLGVSESRICQVNTQIKTKLKNRAASLREK